MAFVVFVRETVLKGSRNKLPAVSGGEMGISPFSSRAITP